LAQELFESKALSGKLMLKNQDWPVQNILWDADSTGI